MTTKLATERLAWTPAEVRPLFEPTIITIVGASPRSGASVHLLESLSRDDCRFPGTIHLINQSGAVVSGRQTVRDAESIEGSLGVVYLMIGAQASLVWLASVKNRHIDAVVMYSGGFAEAGNTEADDELRAWAFEQRVPVMGPQAFGVLNPSKNFMGMCANLPERPTPGSVALLCQSGGLGVATARSVLQRDLGLGVAASYGNGAIVNFVDLGRAILADRAIRCLMIHTESIPDLRSLRLLGREAHRNGQAVVLTMAGASELGSAAAQSHTAAVATPRRLAQGVCEQAGIVWAQDVDEMLDSGEALIQVGPPDRPLGGVGVFAGSGGAAIAITDALSEAGVDLPQPSQHTQDTLRGLGFSGPVSNPLDVGAALLDRPDVYEQQLGAFLNDDKYGILCKVIGSSPPTRGLPAQLAQFASAVEVVRATGKTPFLATPVSQSVHDIVTWDGVPWGAGARTVAVKLRALQSWSRSRTELTDGPWWAESDDDMASRPRNRPSTATTILTGPPALDRLPALPIFFPTTALITGATDDYAVDAFPVVLKSETGLEHRAEVGAVVGPLHDYTQLSAAMTYMAARWGYPISVNGFVPHEAETMIGVGVLDGLGVVSSVGAGGVGAGADLHLYTGPLRQRECQAQVRNALGAEDPQLADLLHALQSLPEQIPGFQSLEFNPVVRDQDDRLVALDVKLIVDESAGSPTHTPNDAS